jgi:hypothetical protein
VRTTLSSLATAALLALSPTAVGAQPAPVDEADVYALRPIPIPEGVVLEVGGVRPVHGDRVYVCTRRGDLWAVDGASTDEPTWRLWADGLSEPLGILEDADGEGLLVVQRGELSRLADRAGDGRADMIEVVNDDWVISGNYHEYAFGPVRDHDGNLWITLNKPFGGEPFGRVDWRGWAVRIPADGGPMEPAVAGLRSPAGVGVAPWGDVFYTDNQGEWCGASKLSILIEGEFHGHPWGIDSAKLPESLVEHPGDVPDGVLMPEAAQTVPGFRLPAVWFPYDVMGRSPSGFAWDTTGGRFGPFAGQLFVGDQYQASVLRVFLEEVDGTWQGACFPFRKGMASGVIRVAFDEATAELIVGSSDRGWASLGEDTFGLERLAWTGVVPFEMKEVHALPDGFRLVFTDPIDPATVPDADGWGLRSFTYLYHSPYGSAEVDEAEPPVTAVTVSDDGLSIELTVEGLREGYVHELPLPDDVRAADGREPLHALAYYTLIDRPGEWPPWEPPEDKDWIDEEDEEK